MGYLAVRYNRARLVAISQVLIAFACVAISFPYFIYGHVEAVDKHWTKSQSVVGSDQNVLSIQPKMDFCDVHSSTDSQCGENNSNSLTVWPAVILLCIGRFISGIGFCCFYVIGFPFLDDNVSKKNSPVYFSTMHTIRIVGPASGYLISSLCLRFYENPFSNESTHKCKLIFCFSS